MPSRLANCTASRRLTAAELAFAQAWEVHAPGLGGWTVIADLEDDGSECLYVDPPLVFGEGFVVRPGPDHVTISWPNGSMQVASVRDAMLAICPLSPDALKLVDMLADAPEPPLAHAPLRD